ncbi:MAG: GAF domain-containing protein [Flavobacteriales bacterium]|nr:GAF domain-containing protein [Flavobacteriales bacterium]
MEENILLDSSLSKAEQYQQLLPQIEALIEIEEDRIANLANISAVLKYGFNFFWVGFYEFKNDELVLGPFQGPLACTRIKPGKGVCGTAYQEQQTILVPDVTKFEGHISCNSATQSEIVIPIIKNNKVVAVLDIDSEQLNHFDEVDQMYLENLAQIISTKW